jgi:transmembrane protein 70
MNIIKKYQIFNQIKKINYITCNNSIQKLLNTDCNENHDKIYSEEHKKYLLEQDKYNGKLIYIGSLTKPLKKAKILSLTSSMFGIGLMPFITDTLSSSSILAQIFVFGSTSFFIFVTPIISVFLTKRYINRIYYNEQEQSLNCVFFNFFLIEYCKIIKLRDLYIPELPGPFSTVKSKSNQKSYFIEIDKISDIEVIEKITGYDKPFNLDKFKKF